MERKDIREHPAFYTEIATHIEQAMGIREMLDALAKKYPHETIPSEELLGSATRSVSTWRIFLKKFGPKRTERLWNLQQSRLRSLGRLGFKERTLDEHLGMNRIARPRITGTKARRFR